MNNLQAKASELVERFIEQAIDAGLTWDEAVAVFGLAAKASAQAAAAAGEDTEPDCVAHARRRLEEAFGLEIHVLVADTAAASLESATGESALLATSRRRHMHKHH